MRKCREAGNSRSLKMIGAGPVADGFEVVQVRAGGGPGRIFSAGQICLVQPLAEQAVCFVQQGLADGVRIPAVAVGI